jgi:hypothetical protein
MLRTLSIIAIVAGLTSVMQAAPPSTGSFLNIPVVGSGAQGAQFTGNFHLTGFHFDTGTVYADGIVTGVLTNSSGATSVLQTVSTPLTIPAASTAALPAAAPAAACSILHLVLGPINLNILGLQVTTNQIVLDVSAIPGAGNLLGNLLCGVANLLNSPTQQLTNLLNQIVGILQGL